MTIVLCLLLRPTLGAVRARVNLSRIAIEPAHGRSMDSHRSRSVYHSWA